MINRPSQVLVGASERLRRHLVMPMVGVDGAEYNLIVEHHGAIEPADIEIEHLSRFGDAGQADDPGRCRRAETTANDGESSRAFDQDIGRQPCEAASIAVVGPAEILHDRWLRSPLVVIEHMHIEVALPAHEGGQQPDWARAGDEHGPRLPHAGAASDAFDVVPSLGEDAGGLEQHAENAQCWLDLDREFGLKAEAFRAVTLPVLDTPLGVAPVAAHIPLPGGTGDAGLRVRPAHDTNDEVAGRQPATPWRRLDHAQRLVTENKALLAGGSGAVGSHDDFAVGGAHTQRQGAHQYRAIRKRRFGHIVEPCRIRDAGGNGDCAHPLP